MNQKLLINQSDFQDFKLKKPGHLTAKAMDLYNLDLILNVDTTEPQVAKSFIFNSNLQGVMLYRSKISVHKIFA
jgi:hypothetical protein